MSGAKAYVKHGKKKSKLKRKKRKIKVKTTKRIKKSKSNGVSLLDMLDNAPVLPKRNGRRTKPQLFL